MFTWGLYTSGIMLYAISLIFVKRTKAWLVVRTAALIALLISFIMVNITVWCGANTLVIHNLI